MGSRDSSVSIVTGYGMEGPGSIPGSVKFFPSPQRPDQLMGPTQPPTQWVLGALSPGVKLPEREAVHSPASSAKVEKCGAIPPLPHMSSGCGA
jgi:hypothetical protein